MHEDTKTKFKVAYLAHCEYKLRPLKSSDQYKEKTIQRGELEDVMEEIP